MQEYLEKVVEAGFKREFEQDENVVRSLPFFATALGVVVAIFTQIATRLPPEGVSAYVIAGLLIASAACFTWIMLCLFQVVRAREFMIPPSEDGIIAYGEAAKAFYEQNGATSEEADKSATEDVRNTMVAAYAEAAVHNRSVNRSKFLHRSRCFTWLVILMALASLCVGVIFIEQQRQSMGSQPGGAGIVQRSNSADPAKT